MGVSVLVCYINIECCAFVYLKDELEWGRLNYIQIKRIREVSVYSVNAGKGAVYQVPAVPRLLLSA